MSGHVAFVGEGLAVERMQHGAFAGGGQIGGAWKKVIRDPNARAKLTE